MLRSSLRSFSTSARASQQLENHNFLSPNSFLGSWEAPRDPKEAEAKLAMLRRDYAKQVKEVRKEYIREMEAMRIEKERKDEARREALRIANEERKKLKAQAAQLRAQERDIERQQFRQMLLKERAEKLENWRMKVQMHEKKKEEKKELLRRQSSMWIDEKNLEKRILERMVEISSPQMGPAGKPSESPVSSARRSSLKPPSSQPENPTWNDNNFDKSF